MAKTAKSTFGIQTLVNSLLSFRIIPINGLMKRRGARKIQILLELHLSMDSCPFTLFKAKDCQNFHRQQPVQRYNKLLSLIFWQLCRIWTGVLNVDLLAAWPDLDRRSQRRPEGSQKLVQNRLSLASLFLTYSTFIPISCSLVLRCNKSIYTIKCLNDEKFQLAESFPGMDFSSFQLAPHMQVQRKDSIQKPIQLPKPPKWMLPACGARFGVKMNEKVLVVTKI